MKSLLRSEEKHNELVHKLARDLAHDLARARNIPGSRSRILSDSNRDLYGKLNKIIGLDVTTSSVKVEAHVTMEALVHFTLGAHPDMSFLPAVVASTRDTTVSEAFIAQSSESSSFAFGTFDCTVTRIEVILDRGGIVHLNSHHCSDEASFYDIPGMVTMLDISVVRAGPYVEVEVKPAAYSDPSILKQNIEASRKEPCLDFLEVLMLTDSYSIITGRFAPSSTHSGTTRVFEKLSDLDLVHWDAEECQRLLMPSDLYLFRRETYDRRVVSLIEKLPDTVPRDAWVELYDFGIIYSVIYRLMEQIRRSQPSIILRLYPILSPQAIGRRASHNITATSDFGMDLCGPSTFCFDNINLDGNQQDREGLHGFHLLLGKTPCKRGKSWDLVRDKSTLRRRRHEMR